MARSRITTTSSIVILLVICVNCINCFDYGPTDRLLSTDPLSPFNYYESKAYDNVTVAEKWAAIAKFYNDYAWPHRTKIIKFIKKAIKEPSLTFSKECVRALKLFGKGLNNEIQWSYEIMDSWGKMKSGFLSGEYVDFGKYDQCLDVKYDSKKSDDAKEQAGEPIKFKGKYCLYNIHWPYPKDREEKAEMLREFNETWISKLIEDADMVKFLPITNAMCFPSVCTRDEINTAIQFYIDKEDIPITVHFHEHCDVYDDYEIPYSSYPVWKQACGYTLGAIISMVVLSTAVSYYLPDYMNDFLRIWDATENTAKLGYEVQSEEGQKLLFISGLRFLYMGITYWAHIVFSSGLTTPETHVGLISFQGPENPFLSGLVQMAGLLVSWNIIVGALLSYVVWHPEIVATKGRLSFFKFTIGRILRTTPITVATIMTILAWSPSWSSGGPTFMKGYNHLQRTCGATWWRELFYLSNQVKAQDICLPHGWYMAADLHLYVVSYFVMLAFYKSAKLGLSICSFMIILGMTLQGLTTWYYNTGMSFAFTAINIAVSIQETHLLHFATLNYISSYAIGIILGYVVVKKIKVSETTFRIGWAIAFATISFAVYWHQYLFNYEDATRTQIIATAALLRTVVAAVGAWIGYSLWLGVPYVTAFFSAHFFLVMARINFATFMFHFLFIWYNNFTSRNPMEFRPFPLIMRWIAEMFIAHIIGYLAYLCFEAPFNNMTKKLFGKRTVITPTAAATDKVSKSDINENIQKNGHSKVN